MLSVCAHNVLSGQKVNPLVLSRQIQRFKKEVRAVMRLQGSKQKCKRSMEINDQGISETGPCINWNKIFNIYKYVYAN